MREFCPTLGRYCRQARLRAATRNSAIVAGFDSRRPRDGSALRRPRFNPTLLLAGPGPASTSAEQLVQEPRPGRQKARHEPHGLGPRGWSGGLRIGRHHLLDQLFRCTEDGDSGQEDHQPGFVRPKAPTSVATSARHATRVRRTRKPSASLQILDGSDIIALSVESGRREVSVVSAWIKAMTPQLVAGARTALNHVP